ncbi:MAG: dNTP triphosphohydrolase, partial [Candidatus Omnitrophica bacterium]|nr:dNTP triphosphohydrolase [Candidatus Omnitrophota bacterium]
MRTRKEWEEIEEKTLAPYAVKSKYHLGRQYKEHEHPLRTAFQRDRDRIIHSTAFRRLEYKTQVFIYHEGDYYRNRLTHTIEVQQIARSIARNLGLNEDLVEAISLAHDIGHTPFGHKGEQALNEIMKKFGRSFEHNKHGLRVVDILEVRYPQFDGLKLTYEVR